MIILRRYGGSGTRPTIWMLETGTPAAWATEATMGVFMISVMLGGTWSNVRKRVSMSFFLY